jgi:hypothetical protein
MTTFLICTVHIHLHSEVALLPGLSSYRSMQAMVITSICARFKFLVYQVHIYIYYVQENQTRKNVFLGKIKKIHDSRNNLHYNI